MGKLSEISNATMAAKAPAPTTEQLRLAKLCDKVDDQTATREKCLKIVEMTKCEESVALIALHDCNQSLEEAINRILEGANAKQEEWQTTSKKPRRTHRPETTTADGHGSASDQYQRGCDPSAPFDGHGAFSGAGGDRHDATLNGGVPFGSGGGRGRRRDADFGAGGSRGGGRGRGFSTRGGRARGGFGGSTQDGHDNEHSTERLGGRNRLGGRGGSRGFNSDYSRSSRGGARGGSSRRQQQLENNESSGGFEGGMGTWNSNETENNTWDNSMAVGKWQDGNVNDRAVGGGDSQPHDNEQRLVVDQWKNPLPPLSKPHPPATAGHGDQRGQWSGQRHPRRSDIDRGRRPSAKVNGPTAAASVANHQVDDWVHDDWGEEEDWQKMTNRVFTNVNVQNHAATASQASTASVAAASTGGSVSAAAVPAAAQHPPTADLQSCVRSAATDTQALNAHVRGENINVNLFGQTNAANAEHATGSTLADVAPVGSGSWSKQATDTLKNELGIGKNVPSNVDQVQRPARPFSSTPKPVVSKVEMPGVPSMGQQLDVEFGEFSSLKMREEQQNYFAGDYGASASVTYGTADLGLSDQQPLQSKDASAVVQQQPQPTVTVLYPRTSVAPSSVVKEADKDARVVSATDLPPGYGSPRQSATVTAEVYSGVVAQQSQHQMAQAQAQQKSQSGMPQNLHTGQQAASQQQPRPYTLTSNVCTVTSVDTTNVGPSVISLPATQNYSSLAGYNAAMANKSVTASNATGKPQINTTAIFNPTNASYPALAAAMPYIYPATDQNYLNALQFLSPAAAAAYPFGAAISTLPFDFTSLNMRDSQQALNADAKQMTGASRADATLTAGCQSLNAPPGLGPAASASAVEQQAAAAQLLTPAAAAAAAAAFHHPGPYQLMPATAAPFYTPFVVPTVTNPSSTATSGNQYSKSNGVFASQPMFYGSGDLQMAQDYGKNVYNVNLAAAQNAVANQNKSLAAQTSNMAMSGQDAGGKSYTAPTLKIFDKTFQQNTATPPPGIGGVSFPSAVAAAAAFHSAGGATPAAAYGAYPPQFMPPHQINMIPQALAQPAQTMNSNDVLANAGQRNTNVNGKGGANIYANKNTAYWAS